MSEQLTNHEELLLQIGSGNGPRDVDRLHSFAFIPPRKLEELAYHALNELWGKNHYALKKYLAIHIPWAIEQKRYVIGETQLYLSAGLLQTRYGTPIYLAFEKRPSGSQSPWELVATTPNMSARQLPSPSTIPSPPVISKGSEIIMAHDHILKTNIDRVQFLEKTPIIAQMCAISGAIQWSLNRGLQIPYWYFGSMNYVVPLYLQSRENITEAPDLVAPVQVNPESLMIRTVLLPHVPYPHARVAVERQDKLPPWLLATWSEHQETEDEIFAIDPFKIAPN